jgi:phosphatidylglycerophosphate synthase
MANALTALRLCLVVPFTVLMARGDRDSALLAGLILAAAIVTDVLDGPVARRSGTAGPAGQAFDHSADFLLVMGGLLAGAARGAFAWVLALLVAISFAQYVGDSIWLRGRLDLLPSRLGHYNGVLYFVPLWVDILARAGLALPGSLVDVIVWALVGSTLLAIAERVVNLTTALRAGSGSRAGRTAGRSRR